MSDGDGGQNGNCVEKPNGRCLGGKHHVWGRPLVITHKIAPNGEKKLCHQRECLICGNHDLIPDSMTPEEHDKENEQNGILGIPNIPYAEDSAVSQFPWLVKKDYEI
jgi:hypothetical protein